MLPVIYSASSSEFSSNGLGVLVDCISCKVTEERNGIFEMELSYPVNGQHADCLEVDAIIKTTAHRGDEGQLFRIYEVDKDLNGELKVMAQHISYQLSFIPCGPFYAENVVDALKAIKETMQIQNNKFSFTTDKTTKGTVHADYPISTRSMLGGVEGSILDIYHGEYEFDNFKVILHNNRGLDRGVTLKYGKNITALSQEIDIADVYTGIRVYYYDTDELVELDTPDKCLWCDNASSFPYPRILTVDATSDFSELTDSYGDKRAPTQEELLKYAQKYLKNHTLGEPSVSIKVSFEVLWDSEEYESLAALEEVKLCDTVSVVFPELNITAKAKVIKTEYNPLLDKYDSIEIGNARSNFTNSIVSMQQDSMDELNNSFTTRLEDTRQRVTSTILGKNGGYKVEKTDANGNIIETLFMDTLDEGTASKVWKWNINGLGYSPNGVNGPYTLAMTKDGEIVADFITTGTLDADNVDVINLKAQNVLVNSSSLDSELTKYDVRITANAQGLTSKVSTTDYTGAKVASLINQSADSVSIQANHINLNGVVTANQTFQIDTSGYMTCIGGNIAGFTISESALAKTITVNVDGVDTDYGVRIFAPSNTTNETLAYAARKKEHSSSSWIYPWYVRYDGYMRADNARIKGQIEAEKGYIGKGTNKITIGEDTTNASIYYNKSSYSDTTSNGFYIGTDGIALGKDAFKVSSSGVLSASGVDISGTLTATGGTIGGFTVSDTAFVKTVTLTENDVDVDYGVRIFAPATITPNSTIAYGVRRKNHTASSWSWPWYVRYDGYMKATNVEISGKITATSGSIGGCPIDASTHQITVYGSNIDNDTLKTKIGSYDSLSVQRLTVTGGLLANALTITNTSGAGITIESSNTTLTVMGTDSQTKTLKMRWYTPTASTTYDAFRTYMNGKYMLIGI